MPNTKWIEIESITKNVPINLDVSNNSRPLSLDVRTGGGSVGTKDYERLNNKPQINGVELIGNKISKEIHVQDEMDVITDSEIDNILFGG